MEHEVETMKQVVQVFKTGELSVLDVPLPQVKANSVLVRTVFSAISAGTEKTKVDTARMSLVQKARSRPDLVKKVIEKARKEGFWSTYEMVKKRLDEPSALGYSSVGIVEEVGDWVEGIQVGDWVACGGGGYANHSEYNVVPARLVAKCPAGTPLDQAAFTTIGSIALQGLRQAEPKLGERFVVLGMGLLGQITSQLLRLNGCEVFALDLEQWKLDAAIKAGVVDKTALPSAANLKELILDWTQGWGADGVIITASTASDGPMEQAGEFCRDKGRVIIVGAVGTRFPREPYFMKEIDIRIARSYGPGRYDPNYEELGLDYPIGFVRFTEQRNMESFLGLLAQNRLNISYLISHRYPIGSAEQAFDLISAKAAASADPTQKQYLGILLDYQKPEATPAQGMVRRSESVVADIPALSLGFVGLGNYASAHLLPAIKKVVGVQLKALCTSSGVTAEVKAKQFGFEKVQGTPESVISSSSVGTVFIVTRHDTHAKYVRDSLKAGKNVFVEKPLCLNVDELAEIREAYAASKGLLTVGFNRRFSPLSQELKTIFRSGVDHLVYRVNAGILPEGHWLGVPEFGGGRIVGEGCHFIDFAIFACGSPVRSVFANAVYKKGNQSAKSAEDVHIQLKMKNGALATVIYSSTGAPQLPKEYIEVHGNGTSVCIDDFRTLAINGKLKTKLATQDKGQKNLVSRFLDACCRADRQAMPISAEELWSSARATLAVSESLQAGRPVIVD